MENYLKQFSVPPCYSIKQKMDDFIDEDSETALHGAARRA